jgi:hypothetical protein
MAQGRQTNGVLRWLGRQVGYVKKAVQTDVRPVTDTPPCVVYRTDTVEEAPHPDDTNLKLRRTTIDEVIEQKQP